MGSARHDVRMRIGLNGGAGSIEHMVEQARRAEADGFHALWYPSAVAGDPVTPMAVCGRETSSIELGTAVLQTYTAHPVLQFTRAAAAAWTASAPCQSLPPSTSSQFEPLEALNRLNAVISRT